MFNRFGRKKNKRFLAFKIKRILIRVSCVRTLATPSDTHSVVKADLHVTNFKRVIKTYDSHVPFERDFSSRFPLYFVSV